MKAERAPKSVMRRVLNCIYLVVFLMVLAGVWLRPVTPSHGMALRSAAMQTSHAIGICLWAYANDHHGHYPEGKTSTEVFQKLLDGKYVTDPSIFYISLIPGKVRPDSLHLKPENVCWDVTCCLDSLAPDGLPVVFLTGYIITYQAGASAVQIDPHPPRTWIQSQWLYKMLFEVPNNAFIAVYYKNNNAMAKRANEDGKIPNFIPADFDPKGKTYRQLTP